MSACFEKSDQRDAVFYERLGNSGLSYETHCYRIASRITQDNEREKTRKYAGGMWNVRKLVTPANEIFYWFSLASEDTFCVVSDGGFASEIVDAELLSMAVSLCATSELCIHFFELAQKAEMGNAPDEQQNQLRRMNALYHDMHHALKDHFFQQLEADRKRSRALFSIID